MTELLSWLLEEENPGVRYLTLRDLKAAHASPQTLAESRQQAHMSGKIPAILAKMNRMAFGPNPEQGTPPNTNPAFGHSFCWLNWEQERKKMLA